MDHVRIGTLGAARITPSALVRPARRIPEVEVLAVAARDPDRARRMGAAGRAWVASEWTWDRAGSALRAALNLR